MSDFKDKFVCQDFIDILEDPNIRLEEEFEEPKIIESEIFVDDWE